MNKYEFLYEKKKEIEADIKKHKLFKMTKDKAIYCVMEKVGMLDYILAAGNEKDRQVYFKNLVHTNSSQIDEMCFFQESLKWICRWCSEYCAENNGDNEKICADEIYELMGMAYAYEKFNNYCFFHSKHLVEYNCYNNILEFDYVYEENYQIHNLYDMVVKMNTEKNEFEKLKIAGVNKTDEELIEMMHRADFSFDYDFNFGEFTLKDYEELSVGINNYVFNKIKSTYVAIPKKTGMICMDREEWIEMLTRKTVLGKNKVKVIIDFFLYDFHNKKLDLSLSYFFQNDKDKILLSEKIFNIQRPAINALRLLAKKQSELFENEQNKFEMEQKNRLEEILGDLYEIATNYTKEQQLRPGMDMIIYDKKNEHLQVIELKYKIPIDSARDITNLDYMLKKAYDQVELAKKYVWGKKEEILEEYFGRDYRGITPRKIDFFVLTNFSIGTGRECQLPTPILLETHYVKLMQLKDGMDYVHEALFDKKKMCIGKVEKKYVRYTLPTLKFKVPEFRIQANEIKMYSNVIF